MKLSANQAKSCGLVFLCLSESDLEVGFKRLSSRKVL